MKKIPIENKSGGKRYRYKQNNFKDMLIRSLNEDEDIRKVITDIVRKENSARPADRGSYITLDEYKAKLNELAETNRVLDKAREALRSEIENRNKFENKYREADNELKCKKIELKSLETELQKTSELRERYSVLEECYQNYLSLSERRKNELKGIIYVPSVGALFACAGKNNFVRRFSEYIIKCIMNKRCSGDEISKMISIFDTLFDIYNDSEGRKKYIRDKVTVGETYRTNKYTTTGLQQGKISDVIFRGYHSADDPEKDFCKSVVRVSE